MQIDVEAFSGETSTARRTLASRIATDAFAWLSDVVRGVVIRVPSGPSAWENRPCSVVVVLRDGRRFDALSVGDNVADALERACHEVRRDIAQEIGRPLRRRKSAEVGGEELTRLERRSGSR